MASEVFLAKTDRAKWDRGQVGELSCRVQITLKWVQLIHICVVINNINCYLVT